MFRHYLITALRNFRRFPFPTAINVLGLSLGLICFISSYVVIDSLGKSDLHFPKAKRIYAIIGEFRIGNSDLKLPPVPRVGGAVAKYLKADFPELEVVARGFTGSKVAVSVGSKTTSLMVSTVDPEFLDIFDLPFIAGDARTALSAPNSAILTEDAAQKLFGASDVVGRRLLLPNGMDVTVNGVISAIPEPSHMGDRGGTLLQFDVLISSALRNELQLGVFGPSEYDGEEVWFYSEAVTYALLPADGSLTPQDFNARLSSFGDRHIPRSQGHGEFRAVPVSQLLLATIATLTNGLPLSTILIVPSFLILAIACLNYANLATALRTARGKELGMRKILGARRGQIMSQYLFEAMLLGTIALAIIVGGVALAAPVLRDWLWTGFQLPSLLDPKFWGFLLLMLGVVVGLGGAYPAWTLSAVRPVEAMRNRAHRSGSRFVPRLFVGFQFAAASLLLIIVIVMYTQNLTLWRVGLNPTEDPKVVIQTSTIEAGVNLNSLRTELLASPQIKSVTASLIPPWQLGVNLTVFVRSPDSSSDSQFTYNNVVNYDYFETLGIGVLAGRVFARERGEDVSFYSSDRDEADTALMNIVIDHAFAEQLGWRDPAQAVGQMLYQPDLAKANAPPRPVQIIGVVEDKATTIIGLGTTSNVYTLMPREASIPIIRIARQDIPAALAHIDAVWKELSPDVPIKRQFADELFEVSYRFLGFATIIIAGLAAFAFVISIMGLFGMAIFITSGRVREIGIRKTMGASALQIVFLLLRDFSKPVIIANVITWPLAYFASQLYLQLFVMQTPLTPIPFVLSLLITLLIAWIAVGGHAFLAARTKPAQVLRYE